MNPNASLSIKCGAYDAVHFRSRGVCRWCQHDSIHYISRIGWGGVSRDIQFKCLSVQCQHAEIVDVANVAHWYSTYTLPEPRPCRGCGVITVLDAHPQVCDTCATIEQEFGPLMQFLTAPILKSD